MMYRTVVALSASLLMGISGAALAQQAEHDDHHPEASQAQEEQAPAPMSPSGQMPSMQNMPQECLAMMEAMPQACMSAMQQMMQGGMMQDGMMHGGMAAPESGEAASTGGELADFTRAYVDAMDEMHGPMMEGVMAEDPDIAFVRGMIPHHQGAIDMAKIVQQYGDDPETKEWATRVIEAQEGEIAEMQAWLERNAGQEPVDFGQTGGTVYSANEGGNSISAIDLGTGSVDTVEIAVSPHNVDLAPDGNLLLAVGSPISDHAHGSADDGHAEAEAGGGILVVLDPQRLPQPVATVEVGAHPAHVVADRTGRAYVSLSGGNEIAVVDLASASVIERIATGAYPHGLRLSPDESELYVANVEDGSVSVAASRGG